MVEPPKDRRYSKTHEWAKKQDDAVIVGITDFAVHELSDLVFIDLPDVGTKVTAGEPFGEIESVKAVSELLAPVSGKVLAVNRELENSLDDIVSSPFEDGWMIKIEPAKPAEYDALLSSKDYRDQLSEKE